MSDLRIAAQQALEALEAGLDVNPILAGEAEEALRAALAQQDEPRNQCGETCERAKLCAVCARGLAEPVPEPVAWMVYTLDGKSVCVTDNPDDFSEGHRALPLYTAPPQRLPLTDEEILLAVGWERAEMYMKLAPNFPVDEAKQETLKNARAVEKASWEKNNG